MEHLKFKYNTNYVTNEAIHASIIQLIWADSLLCIKVGSILFPWLIIFAFST